MSQWKNCDVKILSSIFNSDFFLFALHWRVRVLLICAGIWTNDPGYIITVEEWCGKCDDMYYPLQILQHENDRKEGRKEVERREVKRHEEMEGQKERRTGVREGGREGKRKGWRGR